jgi:hypothetical protein
MFLIIAKNNIRLSISCVNACCEVARSSRSENCDYNSRLDGKDADRRCANAHNAVPNVTPTVLLVSAEKVIMEKKDLGK